MPLKKIALLTIVLIIPSFVYFIMCPFAHSFTTSNCQQLIIVQQQFQKTGFQHKEHSPIPLSQPSLCPLDLQAYVNAVLHHLQTSPGRSLPGTSALIKTTRLNI